MEYNPLEPLETALRDSAVVRTARAVRADGGRALALGPDPVRPLTGDEVARLRANGNTADDWERVRVSTGFLPDRVHRSDFHGDVVLGRFDGAAVGPDQAAVPAGVVRSTVTDAVVGHDAAVRDVGLLSRYVVGRQAALLGCGRVVCDEATGFGNGGPVRIGPQTGGRVLRPFAELTLPLADALTAAGGPPELPRRYAEALAEYLAAVRSDRGVIGDRAVVAHAAVVRNAFVGAAACVEGAARLERCTLLSGPEDPVRVGDGAAVADSLLPWGVSVYGPAVVDRSVLLEFATVEPFGKVVDSVLGPNTVVGGAEVVSSLVGPLVGCHHQSLLIGARWPGGRGNVGYGAGVGCNHTSRAPDQEAVLGEGLFVGLGARLQYPVDLGGSPYTVLACGVALPPQRIAFPFSLIRPTANATPDTSAGVNELVPAWVLSDNLYAVERGMQKFRSRDRTPRAGHSHDAFHPGVLRMVAEACSRLEGVRRTEEVYTDREIPGLGRSVLLEKHRAAAAQCYRKHLQRCLWLEELEQLERAAGAGGFGSVPKVTRERLARLVDLLEDYGRCVEASKARDDARGPAVITDYEAAHTPARDDPVVQAAWASVRQAQARVTRWL
ncbi:DUF4954 family protein [bacterium]|nr:DUF4954 family protein [bacterium]